ncbi:MAG: bifunctional glutamate N-acetyltransferase/amino-acid acetyltransferase ArgJ [Eubacteriales bacterium]|nr:bifunctional glutamate N-acetyltransferase/amino-acid acetyltransferase ArgJ [Eubacteriales bacterium]
MNEIKGGVSAPEGFFATGVSCGIKKDDMKDLAIVCSECPAAAAGVFTTNLVKGHSLQVTMENISNGYATAIIINSGCANACVGPRGYEDAKKITEKAAELLECTPGEILVGSTGVIGKPLDMPRILSGIDDAISNMEPGGGHDAAEAIMTTDMTVKEISVEAEVQDTKIRIGGMAKGSGMIHPNMATLIGVITTDVNISKSLLAQALKDAVKKSFNRISVDGDTSVCDMVIMFANGQADNSGLIREDFEYSRFYEALEHVCIHLAKEVAADGEGATKLIELNVKGAANEDDACKVLSAIAKSPLVKTAINGEDANWGRIITAAGYSGADFDPLLTDISIGDLLVCRNGVAVDFDEKEAKALLASDTVSITINLKKGLITDRMWTCDLSCDYVNINGSYRT